MQVILLCFQVYFLFLSCDSAIVETQYGFVEGRTKVTENGVTYHSFQGIPYARPPKDSLRFRVSIESKYI
jgi:carboxylesterase type B